jgi:UDP-N-acetylmuramate--alanine ligase
MVVFQPHLYSRTRDFVEDFARVLSTADRLMLLPIYPARELPMEGVTSDWLLSKVTLEEGKARVVEKCDVVAEVAAMVQQTQADGQGAVVMTLGAGDIDRLVNDIKQNLTIYE